MPRIPRAPGALGLALTAWDVWRRLPAAQRRALLEQARKHGPKVAEQALAAYKAYRGKRPPL